MNYAAMLPIPTGETFSGWATKWVIQISEDVQSVLPTRDGNALTERNERFGAYLATLSIILSAYSERLTFLRSEFAKANPPPDKGIKAWEASADEAMGETKTTYDFLSQLYDVISKRSSIAQSNIRRLESEIRNIG